MVRLVFMGNGPFAVPALERLAKSPAHQIVRVVTRPDRAQGRHGEIIVGPVHALAKSLGLEVFQPADVNSSESITVLRELFPDLLVVADFGQILKTAVIATAVQEGINIHASLLPKYRGAAPVQWAVWNGETETGVTVIRLAARLDGGEMLAQEHLPIGSDETAGELEARLAELGAGLAADVVDRLAAGPVRGAPQDEALVTKAPKLSKSHGVVDWSRSASEIANQICATQPWPMTAVDWRRVTGAVVRLQLLAATPVVRGEGESASADDDALIIGSASTGEAPGTILSVGRAGIVVAVGAGRLRITRIRPVGKPAMAVADFLRGNRMNAGETFV